MRPIFPVKTIIKVSILVILVAYYLAYTFTYARFFRKNKFFTGRVKVFHSIMIWLIPFIWIKMLKAFLRPTPGSYAFKKRRETASRMKESFGFWAWLGLTNLESPHHEHGHDGHGHHDYGHDSYGHDSSGADTTGHGH